MTSRGITSIGIGPTGTGQPVHAGAVYDIIEGGAEWTPGRITAYFTVVLPVWRHDGGWTLYGTMRKAES